MQQIISAPRHPNFSITINHDFILEVRMNIKQPFQYPHYKYINLLLKEDISKCAGLLENVIIERAEF